MRVVIVIATIVIMLLTLGRNVVEAQNTECSYTIDSNVLPEAGVIEVSDTQLGSNTLPRCWFADTVRQVIGAGHFETSVTNREFESHLVTTIILSERTGERLMLVPEFVNVTMNEIESDMPIRVNLVLQMPNALGVVHQVVLAFQWNGDQELLFGQYLPQEEVYPPQQEPGRPVTEITTTVSFANRILFGDIGLDGNSISFIINEELGIAYLYQTASEYILEIGTEADGILTLSTRQMSLFMFLTNTGWCSQYSHCSTWTLHSADGEFIMLGDFLAPQVYYDGNVFFIGTCSASLLTIPPLQFLRGNCTAGGATLLQENGYSLFMHNGLDIQRRELLSAYLESQGIEFNVQFGL